MIAREFPIEEKAILFLSYMINIANQCVAIYLRFVQKEEEREKERERKRKREREREREGSFLDFAS